MFEDLEEENVDVTPESPDRAIVYAIYSRGEDAGITADEAWSILHDRYPDDPRFLLLHAYSELSERRRNSDAPRSEEGSVVANLFLKRLTKAVSGAPDDLHPQLRDLLAFGSAILAKSGDPGAVAEVRAKLDVLGEPDPKRDERDRAGLRLRRFEREVVRELHDRTEDNKPLGVRKEATAAASPVSEWADAVEDASKPRRKYAATDRFARGELVEHPKFGVGVVTGTEPGKAVILFESGVRKLVAGA